MQISWQINKKRGYLRPTLTYSIHLEPHEKALCLPAMRIPSTIAEPIDSWQEHCWPGQYERADPPLLGTHYTIDIPSHEGRTWQQSIRLPWREDNAYPEVEETFRSVRSAYEEEILKAYASLPMKEEKTLEASPALAKHLASGVLAERLLRFAKRKQEDALQG
ncbi:MAG: hypothetical protein IJU76_04765 [Desulfovibrionaceae bacterium]|nr:hypothetical protein [Desulfovibrionaceae bacterium]